MEIGEILLKATENLSKGTEVTSKNTQENAQSKVSLEKLQENKKTPFNAGIFGQIPKLAQQEQENEVSSENTKNLAVHSKGDRYLSEVAPIVEKDPPKNLQALTQTQGKQIPSAHYPFKKERNTGIDYFDKKKNITLLDALLAKNLGVNNLSYQVIDHKLDADLKQRQIQGSDTAKRQKTLMEIAHALTNHAQSVEEGQGMVNNLARLINQGTGGIINNSQINNKIAVNEKVLGNQIADILHQGRSTKEERERIYDLVKFRNRDKKQIYTNLLELYKLIGNNYYQNLQDFSNRGFEPSQDMIQDYNTILAQIESLKKAIK